MGILRHMTSGKDLKLKRVAADLLVKDIAAAFDPAVSDSRISRIENTRIVTPETVDRYLAALDKCITKSTTTPEAA